MNTDSDEVLPTSICVHLCLSAARLRRLLCKNKVVNNYAVVIHEEPGGGYWAEVPALPGCYSQGESAEELLENIREAISVLELMKESGH